MNATSCPSGNLSANSCSARRKSVSIGAIVALASTSSRIRIGPVARPARTIGRSAPFSRTRKSAASRSVTGAPLALCTRTKIRRTFPCAAATDASRHTTSAAAAARARLMTPPDRKYTKARRAGRVPSRLELRRRLVDGIGFVEREGGDFDVEVVAVLGDHLIRAAHHAGRGLQRAPRGVLERLARREDRLLADHTWALHFFGVAGRIGDHPVAAQKLDGLLALVGDAHCVMKKPV